jgi:hypothetical protein
MQRECVPAASRPHCCLRLRPSTECQLCAWSQLRPSAECRLHAWSRLLLPVLLPPLLSPSAMPAQAARVSLRQPQSAVASWQTTMRLLCRRVYTTSAAAVPSADVALPVADGSASCSQSAASAVAAAPVKFPFWLQPPDDVPRESAWRHFRERVHMKGIASAWLAGVRCMPGYLGMPLQGVSEADMQASMCAVPSLSRSLLQMELLARMELLGRCDGRCGCEFYLALVLRMLPCAYAARRCTV